jgi:hypothetical protein
MKRSLNAASLYGDKTNNRSRYNKKGQKGTLAVIQRSRRVSFMYDVCLLFRCIKYVVNRADMNYRT